MFSAWKILISFLCQILHYLWYPGYIGSFWRRSWRGSIIPFLFFLDIFHIRRIRRRSVIPYFFPFPSIFFILGGFGGSHILSLVLFCIPGRIRRRSVFWFYIRQIFLFNDRYHLSLDILYVRRPGTGSVVP